MNTDNDYDEDGNNIVPCPICLNVHCASKEGGKCPEEDKFVKAMTTPETMRGRFEQRFIISTSQGLRTAMTTGAIHDFEMNQILDFIESELALRDAHHKSLRAKELREIREIVVTYMDREKELGFAPMHVVTEIRTLLDELIEKPTT